MLIASAWKEVYERFDTILSMDIVEKIRDMDPIVIDRPGKDTVYVRLLGDVCPQQGLVVYTSAADFCVAEQEGAYLCCEEDAVLYMQTGFIGLYGMEAYVSRYNQNILRELGIHADENDYLPYFAKLSYGYAPGKVTTAEAEELADILMHVERLLTELGNIDAMPDGVALVRQFDGEKKQWTNRITAHPIVDMMETYTNAVLPEGLAELRDTKGKGTWSVLCWVQQERTDCEGGKSGYRTDVRVATVRGSVQKTCSEVAFQPAEITGGAIYTHLMSLIHKLGKPQTIRCENEETLYKLRPFGEAAGIHIEDRTMDGVEELEAVFAAGGDRIREKLAQIDAGLEDADGQTLEDVLDETFAIVRAQKAKEPHSYVFSVSLGTGLYRHIRIDAHATLTDLHHAILSAFGLAENGQSYRFQLPAKAQYDAATAGEQTLAAVLLVGDRCSYSLDGGDGWHFTAKVLRQIEEPTETATVIRKKGDDPVQTCGCDSENK